eukprot:473662_1
MDGYYQVWILMCLAQMHNVRSGHIPALNHDCISNMRNFLPFSDRLKSRLISTEYNYNFASSRDAETLNDAKQLIRLTANITTKRLDAHSILHIQTIYNRSRFSRLYLSKIPFLIHKYHTMAKYSKMTNTNVQTISELLHIAVPSGYKFFEHKASAFDQVQTIMVDASVLLAMFIREHKSISMILTAGFLYETAWSYLHGHNSSYLPAFGSIYDLNDDVYHQQMYVRHIDQLIANGFVINDPAFIRSMWVLARDQYTDVDDYVHCFSTFIHKLLSEYKLDDGGSFADYTFRRFIHSWYMNRA